jgi:hypothetical protein
MYVFCQETTTWKLRKQPVFEAQNPHLAGGAISDVVLGHKVLPDSLNAQH